MKHCSDLPIFEPEMCGQLPRLETLSKVLVKKGMAYKAFLKYCETGDLKNIQRQIDKGLITVL